MKHFLAFPAKRTFRISERLFKLKKENRFSKSIYMQRLEVLQSLPPSFFACRYGDRTPKSLSARLFALFWITIGVVTVALFNANMTSQLTALSFSSKHYFYGEKVW